MKRTPHRSFTLFRIVLFGLVVVLGSVGCEEPIVGTPGNSASPEKDGPAIPSPPRRTQVFPLNPEGESMDDMLYTLRLGDDVAAEVYVISTNTNPHKIAASKIERLGASTTVQQRSEDLRPRAWQPVPNHAAHEQPLATMEVNHGLALPLSGQALRPRSGVRRTVAAGDTYDFRVSGSDRVSATARRVITDGTITLTVWVADEEWVNGDCSRASPGTRSDGCINQTMVDAIADRFLAPGSGNDIYDWVTAIFGNPWGPHDSPLLIPAEYADNIHILIYDIPNAGGYFSADSYHLGEESNERLMFFLHTSPLVLYAPDGIWIDSLSKTVSTMAHEFQHMIHFYQKQVRHGLQQSTLWLNEMCSVVAQDLVADKIQSNRPRGVAHDDPTAGQSGNLDGLLPLYNYYNDIQVTSWDRLNTNYAINYALGAYLARTYGASVFGAIVQNEHSGVDAIEAALRDQGHPVSFEDMLVNWAVANLMSDDTGAPHPYRYNSGTWITSEANGITFRLGSINLFNYVHDSGLEGPYLHSRWPWSVQSPHSNAYLTLGRSTGTVRLRLTAERGNRITIVVKEMPRA